MLSTIEYDFGKGQTGVIWGFPYRPRIRKLIKIYSKISKMEEKSIYYNAGISYNRIRYSFEDLNKLVNEIGKEKSQYKISFT